MTKRPTALIILDGWGEAPGTYPREWNAIARAKTPVVNAISSKYPCTLIRTSGGDVGLPDGVMGNSEVGHMNLGAGRVVWQMLVRMDKAAEKDSFRSVPALFDNLTRAKAEGRRVHIMGLVSDGSVHSVDRHYFALLELARQVGFGTNDLAFHVFTDGRDCPPQSGAEHVTRLQDWMTTNQCGRIATVSGRYYAMDRDLRWERTQKAYDAMVLGSGPFYPDAVEAVQASYAQQVNDEFIVPCVIGRDGVPTATIQDGDVVFFINYRNDRTRQLSRALTESDPNVPFPRKVLNIHLVTMTHYLDGLRADVAFQQDFLKETMGEVVSRAGLSQVRIAETEKYPHVTFFFSGGAETEFPDERRIMIPSPKEVPTYDLKPEMSAPGIADALVEAIETDCPDFIVCNFANADMVGHTGVVDAAIAAAEAVDKALGRVLNALQAKGGRAIVTADHGNSEEMWNFDADAPHTQHTTNLVRLTLVDDAMLGATLRDDGRLADVSPTLLDLMGIEKPAVMDGASLIVRR